MRYAAAFEQPKIVFPDIARKPRFDIDRAGAYSGDTTFLIPVDDLYLLGLLNSSAVESFFIEVGATVRGGYLRFKRQYVEQIPVPKAPSANGKPSPNLRRNAWTRRVWIARSGSGR